MDYARFNYVAQPEDKGVALMPNIGPYDKHSINWGYRALPGKTTEEEKETLDQWILEKADNPMYRFGRQQFGVIDPSSQTEDLGDDAIKASTYGIANLKRIVPNLIEWTAEDGKDYSDLQTMYNQVLGQYNRYMGHVAANVGGVYEYYKTYDQEGAVYTHVTKTHQKNALKFLQDELFRTPGWLIDENIFNKVEHAGVVDRIRRTQVGTLNSLLDFGRMARMLENETLYGSKAYTLIDMMVDLRRGIWSELSRGQKIDTYRRNLQRAYIERLEFAMTEDVAFNFPARFRRFITFTDVNVSQSDIRPIVRAELKNLRGSIRAAVGRTSDRLSKYHLQDALERIDAILDPK